MGFDPAADDYPTGAWELPEELRMLRDMVRRFIDLNCVSFVYYVAFYRINRAGIS